MSEYRASASASQRSDQPGERRCRFTASGVEDENGDYVLDTANDGELPTWAEGGDGSIFVEPGRRRQTIVQ